MAHDYGNVRITFFTTRVAAATAASNGGHAYAAFTRQRLDS